MPGHYEAIYVHGQDGDFAPKKRPKKEPEKVQHEYCRKHSSYFCPCVKPKMYRGNLPQARKDWDDELKKQEEKRGRARQAQD